MQISFPNQIIDLNAASNEAFQITLLAKNVKNPNSDDGNKINQELSEFFSSCSCCSFFFQSTTPTGSATAGGWRTTACMHSCGCDDVTVNCG